MQWENATHTRHSLAPTVMIYAGDRELDVYDESAPDQGRHQQPDVGIGP